MDRFKVLVVDDSAFMRRIITDLLTDEAQFIVMDTAKNGKEAVEKVLKLQPDVVTLDVEMPIMNGLEALQQIMAVRPTPVVMLSSMTYEGAAATVQALEYGAVDFVQKPSGSISLDLYKVKAELIEKLKIASQAKVRRTSMFAAKGLQEKSAAADMAQKRRANVRSGARHSNTFKHLVAIGTSTGGPKALQTVLTQLPADFAAPIVIVQHMPPKFTRSLAARLDSLCNIRVVEAEDMQSLESGTAYIAPGGYHMTVEHHHTYRIRLNEETPTNGHRPSVDVLFHSLVPLTRLSKHSVIMTGMGSDGARGMKALKDAGAQTTIAESADTCIVYGMPRSAVELQCIDHVLPLTAIADKLIKIVDN